jgi:polysaccharide biosynthesis transport protein
MTPGINMENQQENNIQEEEVDLLAYLRILLRYWWFIGPVGLIGGVGTFLVCLYLPPKYRAETRFEIFENKAIQFGEDIQQGDYRSKSTPLDRHVVLLEGSAINEKIVKGLLKKYPELENYKLSPFTLEAMPVRGAETVMLDVQVDSFSKEAALEYLNLLLSAYAKLRLEESRKELADTREVLVAEDERLDEAILELQNSIDEFKIKNNFIFMETKNNFNQNYIADLLEKANDKQFQLDIITLRLKELKRVDGNKNPEEWAAIFSQVVDAVVSLSTRSLNNQVRSSLDVDIQEWKRTQVELRKVEAEYQIKLKKYKPAHPKMNTIIDHLEVLRVEQDVYSKNILNTLEGRVKTMKAERHSYLATAQGLERSISGHSSMITLYESMTQKLDSLQGTKNSVHAKVLAVSVGNKDKYFTRFILNPQVGDDPVWPNKLKFSALGFILFFGGSSALVLLQFMGRARKYNFSKVIKEYGVTCLATIPNFPAAKLKKNPLFLNTVPKGSVLSESYRSLRLAVEKKLDGGKTLVVTSFAPAEGKTTSAINLALCWAWTDRKVLLIDGDFRRATLRKSFKDAPVEGLIDYLKDKDANIDQYLVKDVCKNLTYLPAGHSEEFVTEILEGKRMRDVLAELEEKFDVIIIDSAPAMRVVDTLRLSDMSAGTLVVARSGRSKPETVAQVLKRLPEDKVIGFMVNDFRAAHVKYSKHSGGDDQIGGYSYGYAYQNYKNKY